MTQSRRPSRIIFKHVFREFTIPFVCALAAFAFLFLVNDVFDDLPDFMSKDVPFRAIAAYFLSLQPNNLVNVIPISVLLAASFMTVMLGRNNELCAMRAAGMSLMTCAIPVWIWAVIAALCVVGIGEAWGAAGLNNAENIRKKYLEKKKSKPNAIAFSNKDAKRDWYCSEINEAGQLRNIVVRQFDDSGRTEWLLTATTATFKDGTCTFKDGSIQRHLQSVDESIAIPATPFKEYKLECRETPEDLMQQGRLDEAISTRDAWRMLTAEIKPSRQVERHLKTIVWHNLTFPLASLVGALFGVALTIANQRSEIMKGFAGAIGILVLFYLVGQVSLVLGKNGWLPPFVAGGLPSLLFTTSGMVLMWRKQ